MFPFCTTKGSGTGILFSRLHRAVITDVWAQSHVSVTRGDCKGSSSKGTMAITEETSSSINIIPISEFQL
jgi:hypothetical protein